MHYGDCDERDRAERFLPKCANRGAHVTCKVGNFCTVLLRLHLTIFIEIGLYLTNTEQTISCCVFGDTVNEKNIIIHNE